MKAKFLLIIGGAMIFFSTWTHSVAIASSDSSTISNSVSVNQLMAFTEMMDSIKQEVNKSVSAQASVGQYSLNTFQKCIVLMPLVLGVLLIMLILGNLRKANYKLSDALSESQSIPTTNTTTGQDGTSSTTTTNNLTQVKSSSRLVMFISSMVTVIIAICLVSFYIYQVFATGNTPNLGSVTTMLLSLGVGVVPYAFNKITN